MALECVLDHLNNGEQNALIAVKQNGWALQYASDNLENNHDVIKVAIIDRARAF